MRSRPPCEVRWLGRIDYEVAWRLQRSLVGQRLEGAIPDTLLLLEHPPVYTYGRRGADGQFLAAPARLEAMGARVLAVDRGGGLTFHGPGQLVGYPIMDLQALRLRSGEPWEPDLHRYLRGLEEVIIRTLAGYGIVGERWEGKTGVWVGGEKAAAIGVKVSRWVTSHGFALNVDVELGWFRHIVACGISDRGVTSMERLLGRQVPLEEVAAAVARHFGGVFGRRMGMAKMGPAPAEAQRAEAAGAGGRNRTADTAVFSRVLYP